MTTEWPVHEKLFPFDCGNDDCRREFNLNDFVSAAESEFVRLTNNEFDFVGLTCPSCHKTTLRKYSSEATVELDSPFFSSRSFVPFMADNALKLDSHDSSVLYFVPPQIPRLPMPDEYPKASEFQDMKPGKDFDWFESKCLCEFFEADINGIIKWENKNQIKVFPRLIGPSSAYHITDRFLWYLKDTDSFIDSFVDEGMAIVWLYELLLRIANDNYLFGTQTNITEDEYKDFAIKFSTGIDYGQNFIDICPDMLKEYVGKRSCFGFERNWKTDFMDKYLRNIFYYKGYYKSKQYYQDKWEYEEMHGKVFKGPFKRIDDSQLPEIMTCQQVAKQLGVEPIILTGYIASGDLPAYRADHTYFDYRSQESEGANIDPEKLIFLSSEVEELLMRHPHIDKIRQPATGEDSESPEDNKAAAYARLSFEESKWNESLGAAVKVGIRCANGDPFFDGEALIKYIDEIAPGVPVSTIEAIWEALPVQYKEGNGQIDSTDLKQRKERETIQFSSAKITDGVKRNLENKKDKSKERLSSIKAALRLAIDLQKEGKTLKNPEIDDKIFVINRHLIATTKAKIRKAIPKELKRGPGNPHDKKPNEEETI